MYELFVVVVVLLIVGWLPTINSNVHMGMLKIPGFQGNGILLMMTTYFIGHLVRYGCLDKIGKCWMWFIAYVASIVALSCGRWHFLYSNAIHHRL